MSIESSLCSLFAGLVLAGCGLLHVQTSSSGASAPPGGSAAPAAGASPAGASAGAAPAASGEDGARILAAFRAFDYHTCGDECGGVMRRQAGIEGVDHVNPRAVIAENPAPAWIVGWEQLSAEREDPAAEHLAFQTLTLAAAHQRWQADCDARYAKLDGELRAQDAAYVAKLDAAKALDGGYARAQAIAALGDELERATPGRDYEAALRRDVGAREAIERALHDELAQGSAPYAYLYLRLEPEARYGTLRPRGTADAERARYCAHAFAGEVTALPPPPRRGFSEIAAHVRAPVSDEARAAAAAEAAENRTRNAAALGAPKADAGQRRASALPAGVVALTGAVVKVERRGAGGTLVLETVTTGIRSDNCKSTGRARAIRADGVIERDQTCDMKSTAEVTQYKVALAALPPAALTPLATGARVTVLGTETKRTSKKQRGGRFGDDGTLIEVTVDGTFVVDEQGQAVLRRAAR